MRISDWSSDVCSSDLALRHNRALVSPWRRVGDAHGRKQTPLTIGQLRIAAGLRRRGVTAARRKHHRCKEKRIFHVRSPARREAKPIQTAASIRMTLMAERIRPVSMLAQASFAWTRAWMKPSTHVERRSKKELRRRPVRRPDPDKATRNNREAQQKNTKPH